MGPAIARCSLRIRPSGSAMRRSGSQVDRPLLIFDGHCAFCRIWIEYFRKRTGDRVDYAPSQEVGERYSQISREAFAQSVQLVRVDGTVASGARAVFEAAGRERVYESVPLLAPVSEWAYR